MEENLKKEIEEIIKELLNQDSIEIGSASKNGIIKVYCNFAKTEEAEKKIQAAIKILKDNRKEVLGE